MAVLSAETNMAGVSELSPAIFLSSATLTGFILMKSKIAFGRKMEKNNLLDHIRAHRFLRYTQNCF